MADDKRAPAGFQWDPDALLSRSKSAAAPAAKPPLRERLKLPALRKGASFVALLGAGFVLGAVVLGLFVFELAEPQKDGTLALGGLKSSLRLRPKAHARLLRFKREGFLRLLTGSKAAGAAGAADDAAEGDPEALEPGDVAVELNVELPDGETAAAGAPGRIAAGSRAVVSGGASASRASGEAAAPKFSPSSVGSRSAKTAPKGRTARAAMAATWDRRRADTRAVVGRSVPRGGASASAPGSAAPGESRPSSLGFVTGGAEAAPGEAAQAAAAAQAPEGGGSSSSAGRGGGGAAAPAVDAPDPADVTAQIDRLFREAAKEADKAAEEKKKAMALAAGGHLPQAHYHYDRAEKHKEKAEELGAQAGELSAQLAEAQQAAAAAGGSRSSGAQEP